MNKSKKLPVSAALLITAGTAMAAPAAIPGTSAGSVYDVSGKLELFYDDFLIGSRRNLAFVQHSPQEFAADESKVPGHYATILHDGEKYRMYYRGVAPSYKGKAYNGHPGEYVAVTYSKDCLRWQEPDLKRFSGKDVPAGTIWHGNKFTHNLVPMIDPRPECPPEERYKAVSGVRETGGLFAFYSADGINWKHYDEKNPIFKYEPKNYGGHFLDSQNSVFYSEHEKCFVMYLRVWKTADGLKRLRSFGKTTSKDFKNWTPVEFLKVNKRGEHLYVSGLRPYVRAPHYYIGAATRYFGKRGSATDVVLLFSRFGQGIQRLSKAAWIKPGLSPDRWLNRTNYITLGMYQLTPEELIFYHGPKKLFYKLRTDGFASLSAGETKGSFETCVLTRRSGGLKINLSTSAGGSFALEVCDENGKALPGYTFKDFGDYYGDAIAYEPQWKGKKFSELPAGKFKLRVKMKECDLYSMDFR